MKKCCICEEYFPSTLEYFHARTSSDDGLRCDCKVCRKLKKSKDYNKPLKKCSKCNIEKPNTNEFFQIKNGGIRARNRSTCKDCIKVQMRKRHLIRTYGITEDEYETMYQNQNGKCFICETHHKVLCVDHNHETNKVRALLCDPCNHGIGSFKENIKLLEKAINYIITYNHGPETN